MVAGMGEMRKITVEVAKKDLEHAQSYSGEGVTETIRHALRKYVTLEAQRELRKLRGTFRFSIDLEELRADRE
jgi:hypothetical protein